VQDRTASNLGALFKLERGSTFLWNVGIFMTVYAASRPRREQSWPWFWLFYIKCWSYNLVNGLSEGHWLTLTWQNLKYRIIIIIIIRRRRSRRMRKKRERGRAKSWACLEVKLRANCSRARLSHPCCLPILKIPTKGKLIFGIGKMAWLGKWGVLKRAEIKVNALFVVYNQESILGRPCCQLSLEIFFREE
jgi:hypothetical protein